VKTRKTGNEFKVLDGKPDGKRLLARFRHR
jgi:hypothetical protein